MEQTTETNNERFVTALINGDMDAVLTCYTEAELLEQLKKDQLKAFRSVGILRELIRRREGL